MTDQEKDALKAASEAGGKYLESIRQFDLSRMTPTQWDSFVEAVARTSWDKLAELSDDEIPF